MPIFKDAEGSEWQPKFQEMGMFFWNPLQNINPCKGNAQNQLDIFVLFVLVWCVCLVFFFSKSDCSRPNSRESPAAQCHLLQRPLCWMAGSCFVPCTSIFWQRTFGKNEPRSFLKITVPTVKITRAFIGLKKEPPMSPLDEANSSLNGLMEKSSYG